MAHVVPFDTLAYAKTLKAHGISAEHAEAHTRALLQVLQERMSIKQETQNIVDKPSVSSNKDFENNIDTTFARLESNFSKYKIELIQWMCSISFCQAIIIILALK